MVRISRWANSKEQGALCTYFYVVDKGPTCLPMYVHEHHIHLGAYAMGQCATPQGRREQLKGWQRR